MSNETAVNRGSYPQLLVRNWSCWLGVRFLIAAALALSSHPVLRAYAAEPSQVFVKNCAPCHSKDGRAQTPAAKKLGVKDLSLSKLTDAEIIEAIKEGKQAKQKQAKMPAFKDKLTPEELQLLVKTVKGFRK